MAMASFIWANNSSSNSSGDLAVSNVEALHASTLEFVCENADDSSCSGKIHLSDGSFITSPTARGPLYMENN